MKSIPAVQTRHGWRVAFSTEGNEANVRILSATRLPDSTEDGLAAILTEEEVPDDAEAMTSPSGVRFWIWVIGATS